MLQNAAEFGKMLISNHLRERDWENGLIWLQSKLAILTNQLAGLNGEHRVVDLSSHFINSPNKYVLTIRREVVGMEMVSKIMELQGGIPQSPKFGQFSVGCNYSYFAIAVSSRNFVQRTVFLSKPHYPKSHAWRPSKCWYLRLCLVYYWEVG